MTIEEYAQQMLSCTDPDEVVRIWNEYGKGHTGEQVVALHKKSGVAQKVLWAVTHTTPEEPARMPKSNYSGGRIKVGDSVVWCPQGDSWIKCAEKYGPITHLLGKIWIVSDVIGPHPTNQRKQYVSIKLEGDERTYEYHENFFKVVGWGNDKDWDFYPTFPEKGEQ